MSLLVVASLHARGIRSTACELQDCIDCVVISASGAPFLALHVLPLTTKLGVFPLSFPIHGFPFSEVGNRGTAPINPGEISSLHYRFLGGDIRLLGSEGTPAPGRRPLSCERLVISGHGCILTDSLVATHRLRCCPALPKRVKWRPWYDEYIGWRCGAKEVIRRRSAVPRFAKVSNLGKSAVIYMDLC